MEMRKNISWNVTFRPEIGRAPLWNFQGVTTGQASDKGNITANATYEVLEPNMKLFLI
jgi:hypothetical protein